MVTRLFIVFGIMVLFASCSDDDTSEPEPTINNIVNDTTVTNETVFEELYNQGIDRYLGKINPTSSNPTSTGVMEHIFSSADGPVCFTGNQFSMFTRNGSGNGLLIFLQGGGFCAPTSCEATETGIPLVPFGMLSPIDPQSPVSNYKVGYVPYCDGSFMMGDTEVDSDGDSINDRFFKGLQNLSASLDIIATTFPMPSKIVLAGNSAGGFAVHAALPLVRKLYPNVKIYVINDSGIGILNPGSLDGLLDYWNAKQFLPQSCTDCIGSDGNYTGYHKYQLEKDKNIVMAYISSKQDSTTSASLMGGGPAYEMQLKEAATELKAAYPNRFNSLIENGDAHTYLIRQFNNTIGGITVKGWISNMLREDNTWDSVTE